MTFLTKVLSSSRTNSNGQINPNYMPYPEENTDTTNDQLNQISILLMSKEELIRYAEDMYGLKLHRKMSAGNMLKEIYDSIHIIDYVPPNERVRKTPVKASGTRSVGRPKGSKNKSKKEVLIDKI